MGGQIVLSVPQAKDMVNHIINMDGIISASSATQVGGKIILEGGNIKVSGRLDANGESDGGTIHIGGGYQGKGDEINSKNTIITATSKIEANSLGDGNGGEVIIWADNATGFAGTIEAKGNDSDGTGGFVEVSGKEYLDFQGEVDLSGAQLGTLLLDPDAINIVAGAANPAEFSDDLIAFAENASGTSTLGADTISTRLSANANVVLQADSTIDVNAAITSSGSGNLSLQTGAGGVISVNQAINVNAGNLSFIADTININSTLSGLGNLYFDNVTQYNNLGIGTGATGHNVYDNAELDNIQSGFNRVEFNSKDGNINIEAYTWNNDVLFEGLLGTITVNGIQDYGNNDVTFLGRRDINLNADLTGSGNVRFLAKGNDTITVGDDAAGNSLVINDSDLAHLTDGFSQIQFQSNNGTINYDTSTPYTFNDDVSFVSSGNGITLNDLTVNGSVYTNVGKDPNDNIVINGSIDTSGVSDGDIRLDAYDKITLNGDLITNGGDITIVRSSTGTAMSLANDTTFNANTGSVVIGTSGIDATSNDLTILADEIDLTGALIGSGNLKLGTGSAMQDIEIGTSVNLAALNLTDTDLSNINMTGSATIGDTANTAGTILIDSVDVEAQAYDLAITGGQITINNGLKGGGSILLQAQDTKDIIVNSAIEAKGGGNSLILSADGDFINNFGVGALDADTGRWIVYSQSSETINKTGLIATQIFQKDIQSLAPASVPGTLDTIIYKNTQEVSAPSATASDNVITVLSQGTSNSYSLDGGVDVSAEQKEKPSGSTCLANVDSVNGSCIIH